LTIFFFIIYASSVFSATITFHYCGGQLSDISVLNFGGNAGCSCNPKKMPKDCCQEKLIYNKVDNHKSIGESYTISIISFSPDLPPVIDLHNLVLQADSYRTDNFYNYIHPRSPHPIYLLNQVFRL
jgi:hypothetical protein